MMSSFAGCSLHGRQPAVFRMGPFDAMNFLHSYDLMRYLLDFSWTWLQCRIVSREYVNAAKVAILDRMIEVGCDGDGEITSLMLVCMINMPWGFPMILEQFPSAVWKIVDSLCIRVAPRNTLLETGVPAPVVLSNNILDNTTIVIWLSLLAEGTGYRKAIDALLNCVEIRDELGTATATSNTRCSWLSVMLAKILDEEYEREEVAFGLVDMVSHGQGYWAYVVLQRATTFGYARNVSRFLLHGRIVNPWPGFLRHH